MRKGGYDEESEVPREGSAFGIGRRSDMASDARKHAAVWVCWAVGVCFLAGPQSPSPHVPGPVCQRSAEARLGWLV
jgi:hypothetical protein